MTKIRYDIVLASYNGAKYIEEQINSIVKCIDDCKTATINKFIITDDNSSDDTLIIVKKLAQNIPYLYLYTNELAKGVINNFQNGINKTSSEFVFFSDQDDIWDEKKITKTIEILLESEDENKPLLVITNINFVNENLSLLRSGHDFDRYSPSDELMTVYRSFGQGCTMAVNRKLLNFMGQIPTEAVMHDWWMLLIASNFGKVRYITTPLLNYRQHSNNVCGGTKHNNIARYFNLKNQRQYMKSLSMQSGKFVELYHDFFTEKKSLDAHVFLSQINNKNIIEKISFVFSDKVKMKGLKNRIKLLLQMIAI